MTPRPPLRPPLRSPLSAGVVTPPTLTTATILSSGETLRLVFSEPVVHSAGFALTCSGGGVSLAYATGSGTDALFFELGRVVDGDETATLGYAHGDVESLSGRPLAAFDGREVENDSLEPTSDSSGSSASTESTDSSRSESVPAGGDPNDCSNPPNTVELRVIAGSFAGLAAGQSMTLTRTVPGQWDADGDTCLVRLTTDGGGPTSFRLLSYFVPLQVQTVDQPADAASTCNPFRLVFLPPQAPCAGADTQVEVTPA